jgi:hypothetical protein
MGLNMNHVGRPRDKKMLHATIVAVLIEARNHSRRMRREPVRTHRRPRDSEQFDPVTALPRSSVSSWQGRKLGLMLGKYRGRR